MDQQLEVIMKEVNAFQMVPHLLWGLWSIKNSVGAKILFAYWVCKIDLLILGVPEFLRKIIFK